MATRVAVLGPGRLGRAMARRWVDSAAEFVGFVGRSPESASRAVAFCRAGRVMQPAELAACDAVLVSVRDDDLATVVAAAARDGGVGADSLWFHASGFHDLDVLQPVADAGARVGVLHPLCPIPSAELGVDSLAGAPATLVSRPSDPRLLELAAAAGLRPIELDPGVDRANYHAACALAANGVTALFDLVESLLARAMENPAARAAAAALIRGAVDLCADAGARDALSGPVQRGDADVVAGHLGALSGHAADSAYRALMQHAATLAAPDLSPEALRRLQELLRPHG